METFKAISICKLLILTLIFIGCSPFENPKFINLDSIELVDDQTENLVLISKVSVYNPNVYSISSKDVSFNLYVDDLLLGIGKIQNELILSKNDTTQVLSSLIIKKSQLKSFINMKDSIYLNIIGSTDIPYISKKYYFDFQYKLNTDDFISLFTEQIINDINVQISKVKIKKIDFSNIDLEVTFVLDNKSKMECVIKEMGLNIFKTKEHKDLLGTSKIKESFTVKADTLNEFNLVVKVNTLKMGTAFFSNSLTNKNSLFIEVNSKVNYNNIEIPYSINKRVDYNPLTLEIQLK